ncbi:calmodulin-like protein [Leptotrombidium deliense]|uniref:Calmodulin-like protein n=1 Tax=Leptotrombidium deliense TaxID=299467 RepID=A0A443S6Q8_9ACAR|nr:calmodulin-like protein [Leptotrombidium deliense]
MSKTEGTVDKIANFDRKICGKRDKILQTLNALGLNEFEIDAYLEAFSFIDANSDGKLSEAEIHRFCSFFERSVPFPKIRETIAKVVRKRKGTITIDYLEFVEMIHARRMQLLQSPENDELKLVFQNLVGKEKSSLSSRRLQDIMTFLGVRLTDDEAKVMITNWSKDSIEEINYDKFLAVDKFRG